MPRLKTTFTVDASSIQDEKGATITFRSMRRKTWRAWLRESGDDGTSLSNDDIVKMHVVKWKGILDDSGKELPSPSEAVDVLDELYMHEIAEMCRLLAAGPDGDKVKN